MLLVERKDGFLLFAFHMIPSKSKPEGSRNKQLLHSNRDILWLFNSRAGSCDLFKEQAIIGDKNPKKITVL